MRVVFEKKINKSYKIENSKFVQIKALFSIKNMSIGGFIRSSLLNFLEEELKNPEMQEKIQNKITELELENQYKIEKGLRVERKD